MLCTVVSEHTVLVNTWKFIGGLPRLGGGVIGYRLRVGGGVIGYRLRGEGGVIGYRLSMTT